MDDRDDGGGVGWGAEEATRRERIFRRDDFRCAYCGEVYDPRSLTLDHVEPRMRGGDHSDGNLVTACGACNTAKGAEPAWSYLSDKAEQRANFFEHAEHVWPRLRRAIEEAADRPVRRRRTR